MSPRHSSLLIPYGLKWKTRSALRLIKRQGFCLWQTREQSPALQVLVVFYVAFLASRGLAPQSTQKSVQGVDFVSRRYVQFRSCCVDQSRFGAPHRGDATGLRPRKSRKTMHPRDVKIPVNRTRNHRQYESPPEGPEGCYPPFAKRNSKIGSKIGETSGSAWAGMAIES